MSVAVLAARNLYDDELLTLYLSTGRLKTILEVAAEGDVHPAGMYLLGRLGWQLTHSYRWLNLLPLAVLYAGLAVFVVQVTPLIRTRRAQVCFLLLATLHPELLLWSNTFRWYCPWTGLGLLTLTLALQPGRPLDRFSAARAGVLGCLSALMFYLNYITLFFVVGLTAALIVRYRGSGRRALIRALGVLGAVLGVLVVPQLRVMLTVHLQNGRAQRYGIGASLLRLVQALGQSEAFLPWHPLALLAVGTVGALSVLGIGVCIRRSGWGTAHQRQERDPGLISIATFSLMFFAAIAFSGLGGKPRTALLLIPVVASVAGLGLERLSRRAQTPALLLLAVWSGVGVIHLLGRYGLVKTGMTDRPEEVVNSIQQSLRAASTGSVGGSACAVVVTYDSALAFQLARARLPEHRIISPYGGQIFGGSGDDLPAECVQPRLFVVESYIGGSPANVSTYTGELQAAVRFFEATPTVQRIDRDPDQTRKGKLARIAGIDPDSQLPEFRYILHSGTMDRSRYGDLVRALPHFYSLQNDRGEDTAETGR